MLEKGAEVGAHVLSGCVFEPRALDELIPDWRCACLRVMSTLTPAEPARARRARGAPVTQPATSDSFLLLSSARHGVRLPTPPQQRNHGNFVISLSQLTRCVLAIPSCRVLDCVVH